MRPLGGEAEHDAALAEVEARPHLALGERRLALHGAEAERHHVDALGAVRRAAASGPLACSANRRSPGPSGAPPRARAPSCPCRGCPRAPRESARRSDRAPSPPCESVPTAAPCSRGCARGPRPRARPAAAAASARRAPTARGCARSPARSRPAAAPPRDRPPAAAASRLMNAVKRIPGGACGEQRRDQLARGHLHAAGLARHEEDQVQADVGSIRGQCRARLAAWPRVPSAAH